MTALAFTRLGGGAPLVLLHGLGSAREAWDPVIPALAEHFDVLALDLPGFGSSPPLPSWVVPDPRAMAAFVGELLDHLGIVRPHVVGNSLGGWVALELAHLRPTASITLLSPAGMWARGVPLYNRISLRTSRLLAQRARTFLSRLVNFRLGRILVLGQTHGRPWRMSAGQARGAINAMADAPGFEAALRATADRHYVPTSRLTVPVAVAFGSRDHLLLRGQSRLLERLPGATHIEVLSGCGHVPMGDDPCAVIDLITRTTRRP